LDVHLRRGADRSLLLLAATDEGIDPAPALHRMTAR
jgi:hypothetical protein